MNCLLFLLDLTIAVLLLLLFVFSVFYVFIINSIPKSQFHLHDKLYDHFTCPAWAGPSPLSREFFSPPAFACCAGLNIVPPNSCLSQNIRV